MFPSFSSNRVVKAVYSSVNFSVPFVSSVTVRLFFVDSTCFSLHLQQGTSGFSLSRLQCLLGSCTLYTLGFSGSFRFYTIASEGGSGTERAMEGGLLIVVIN